MSHDQLRLKKDMKVFIGLLAGLMLLGTDAQARSKSATRSGQSEEITLNILRSRVPQGVTITDTNCIEIGTAGFNYSYRCTIKWEE